MRNGWNRTIRLASVALLAVLSGGPSAGIAATGSAQPDIIPVRLTIGTGQGDQFTYSIPIRFGAQAFEALLDTGSLPTLVLKGRVPPRNARPTGQTFAVTYGGSRTITADVVDGKVGIGAIDAAIGFGVVSVLKCVPAGSTCPVTGEGPRDAFFAGRFPVIVGARAIASPYPVTSALKELGVHRFVLTAPRRGEGDGTLQLDPNANATSAFVPITDDAPGVGVPPGSVRGCLRDLRNGASFCGAVFLDSGSTGIKVVPASGSTQGQAWFSGDAAQLEFTGDGGAELAGVDFPVHSDPATSVTFEAPGQASEPVIYAGQLPYIGLSVLTDLDALTYAVLPRARARDGVVGHAP